MEYGCQRFSLAHLCFGRPATRATDVISCFLIVNMSTNLSDQVKGKMLNTLVLLCVSSEKSIGEPHKFD